MNPAVLVIDVQRVLCTGQYEVFDAPGVIGRINEVTRVARAAAAPVIFIQHETRGGGFDHGTPDWQLAPGLTVHPADQRLRKTAADAFHGTELQAMLQGLQVDRLVVCGLQSEFCVDTTTRRALALGYPVTLVEDGHSTLDNEVLGATQITRHHNVTLANLSSFGPRVTLCAASELRL